MQTGFTILEHPADLGIEACGATLNEAFEQSAIAMMSIILDLSKVSIIENKCIELTAVDIHHLLVKWLTEILYLYDGQQFAASQFRIESLNSTTLRATIFGERLSLNKHTTKLDVKAITYHQLSISESEQGAVVRVYLDI